MKKAISSKTEHEKAIERIMNPPPQSIMRWKSRVWSKDELALLKKLYSKKSVQYIAENLSRTEAAVHRRACIIGITKECIGWSSQEEKLLKKLWSKKSRSYLANIIGRSAMAISLKAHKLGLSVRNK